MEAAVARRRASRHAQPAQLWRHIPTPIAAWGPRLRPADPPPPRRPRTPTFPRERSTRGICATASMEASIGGPATARW